jgi:hypothetical protein
MKALKDYVNEVVIPFNPFIQTDNKVMLALHAIACLAYMEACIVPVINPKIKQGNSWFDFVKTLGIVLGTLSWIGHWCAEGASWIKEIKKEKEYNKLKTLLLNNEKCQEWMKQPKKLRTLKQLKPIVAELDIETRDWLVTKVWKELRENDNTANKVVKDVEA